MVSAILRYLAYSPSISSASSKIDMYRSDLISVDLATRLKSKQFVTILFRGHYDQIYSHRNHPLTIQET